jgi:hypothetical protein
MGDTGIELSSLTPSKTAISQTQRAKNGALDGKIYPDLAEIVKAWPELPGHIKAAIKALIRTRILGGK